MAIDTCDVTDCDAPAKVTSQRGGEKVRTCMAHRAAPRAMFVDEIPPHVLEDRGPLSRSEAIAVYLCEDPDGPELPQVAAADIMRVDPRNVQTFLTRARDKQTPSH